MKHIDERNNVVCRMLYVREPEKKQSMERHTVDLGILHIMSKHKVVHMLKATPYVELSTTTAVLSISDQSSLPISLSSSSADLLQTSLSLSSSTSSSADTVQTAPRAKGRVETQEEIAEIMSKLTMNIVESIVIKPDRDEWWEWDYSPSTPGQKEMHAKMKMKMRQIGTSSETKIWEDNEAFEKVCDMGMCIED